MGCPHSLSFPCYHNHLTVHLFHCTSRIKGQYPWGGYWCCCVCMDVIMNMGFLYCKFALSTRFSISLLLIPFLTWGSILYWIFFYISIATLRFFFFLSYFLWGLDRYYTYALLFMYFFLSPLMCNMGKYSYVWFLKPVKPLKFSKLLLCNTVLL